MPGIVAAVLFLFAREQIKREQARADRLEAQLTLLNTTIAEKFIPALVAAATTLEDSQQLIRDLARGRQP